MSFCGSDLLPGAQEWLDAHPQEPNPMVRLHGPGPECKTCGQCERIIDHRYGRRTFYKCPLRGDTSSAATDHRLSWRACARFEVRP